MDVAKKKILVVDDEVNVRDSLKLILSRTYEVETAESGEEALALLQNSQSSLPNLMLVDVMMPGIDGIELLRQVTSSDKNIPVIMLTASTQVKTAVDAMKIGAVDYLNKPYEIDELLELIKETLAITVKNTSPSREKFYEFQADFGCLVGQHTLMKGLYRKIEQLAACNATVLLTGDSGTGKELVAREIHKRGEFAEKAFVTAHCASINNDFEQALERAQGGTLFLDEVALLTQEQQAKMLHSLNAQECRIIAATNHILEDEIAQGNFREDLFYRINVVTVEIPALRERKDDIPILIEYFLERFSLAYDNRYPNFSDQALEILSSYGWPGNVRELENLVESILALNEKDVIEKEDLPSRFFSTAKTEAVKEKVLEGVVSFEEAERVFETELITKALKQANYVQTKAADLLGISRRILKYKMDKLGISDK